MGFVITLSITFITTGVLIVIVLLFFVADLIRKRIEGEQGDAQETEPLAPTRAAVFG